MRRYIKGHQGRSRVRDIHEHTALISAAVTSRDLTTVQAAIVSADALVVTLLKMGIRASYALPGIDAARLLEGRLLEEKEVDDGLLRLLEQGSPMDNFTPLSAMIERALELDMQKYYPTVCIYVFMFLYVFMSLCLYVSMSLCL